jgi:hypothetical protein
MLTLLAPTLALAQAEVLGWSKDGAWFALQRTEDNGGAGGTSVGLVSAQVVGAVTGEKQDFHLKDFGGDSGEVADAKGTAAFEAWRKAHPLTKAAPARASKDGRASAEVTAKDAAVTGWSNEGGGFAFDGALIECPDDGSANMGGCGVKQGTLTAWLTVGGKKRPAATFMVAGRNGKVTPYWSPDGSRVAWVLEASAANPFSGEPMKVLVEFSGDGSKAVELLADEALLKQTAPKVASALRKAGFPPARSGKAVKPREKSVVYAASGSEALAKQIAAAVPGGATVEALSWKTDCDVVVAVGKSAK